MSIGQFLLALSLFNRATVAQSKQSSAIVIDAVGKGRKEGGCTIRQELHTTGDGRNDCVDFKSQDFR